MGSSSNEVWSLGRLLTWTTGYLREHGSESARLDAEVLLAHALNCGRVALYTRFDEPAADAVRDRFRDLVRRRSQGAPVAYLVGHKEFFSLDLEVGPAVLIPRPDSEFVLLEFLRVAEPVQAPHVADIGTGSGNLAVAAAHQRKDARVWATDSSPDALKIAQHNAERHTVADRIQFLQGHLLSPLPADQPLDAILSNPPYIPSAEIPNLPVGVRDYEPHAALDGGPNGTEVVAQIIGESGRYLKPGGHLILEIGAPQEAAVRKLVEEHAGFHLLPTVHDYAGHPRVVSAQWQPK